MAIHLSNFFNSQNRKSKMGDFQDLEHVDGVSISTTSANLYNNPRDDLVMFYFREGANYASVYTQSKIISENIKWNLNLKNKKVNALMINARNANAFTGKKGYQGLKELADKLATHLSIKQKNDEEKPKKIKPNQILFGCTGTIGENYPTEKIKECIPNLIKKIKNSGISISLYMWDSVDNKPSVKYVFDYIENKATFDPADSKKYSIEYIHLFAEDVYFNKQVEITDREYDLCFIGTGHSNRASQLKSVLKNKSFSDFRFKIHLFYGNYLYDIMSRLQLIGFSELKPTDKKLSKIECADIFSKSKYVLDITHPKQRGLTSRTFEALCSGAILVTNNINAPTLIPSFNKNIVLYDDLSSINIEQLKQSSSPSDNVDRYPLSLSYFCSNILELINK